MSIGLIALLDDVAALAKVAAASLDDVLGQAAKAGAKSAGVVIDDAAVTPRYVVGFTADRELPIIWRIFRGSLRNKLVILLPAALALAYFAPWVITPILMAGGLYLAYEGAEKVYEKIVPHKAEAHEAALVPGEADARMMEEQKVASAIKTDFILSAEIMAITLSGIPEGGFWTRAAVLAIVAVGITMGVYGAVAMIVKADDVGVAMARSRSGFARAIGRGLVRGMPVFLKALALVGTAAMVWVGGGIILHGLEEYGFGGPAHAIHNFAAAVAGVAPFAEGAVQWAIEAAGAGIAGLALGLLAIPAVGYVVSPAVRAFTRWRAA